MPPACRISHVAGLGSGFASPRTGTPFFFDEDRQDWLNSLGDSYGGFYALERWENGFLTTNQPADLRIELPPDRSFWVPALVAPGAFNGLLVLPPESIRAGMDAGFRQDAQFGLVRQSQPMPQPLRQTGPSSAMFAPQLPPLQQLPPNPPFQ